MSTIPAVEHDSVRPHDGDPSPVLRTLSPALRGLERSLRSWLDGQRRFPLSTLQKAALEGLATDLRRQADALDVDRPQLVVMLMGGTGVGKSTLLNALAGGKIAAASFTRPTTRDPVVYYHESVRPDRLDPSLRHCRLVPHDRSALQQKILVDTPDVDSNDLMNREKLLRLLPVADVVLYVGSQEKYHDKLVWELFLQQRKRRAFAFVLNKWDRCLHPGAAGMRPDENMLRDLEEEGFDSPLLFRTCAQHWVDQGDKAKESMGAGNTSLSPKLSVASSPSPDVPEGEQFPDLTNWLEMGLSRLEIEAIKARGVSQLLAQMEQTLRSAAPPDLAEVAARVKASWIKPLTETATATADVLVNSLEPYQREIEHHFALEGQRRFRGPMAWYLHLITRARYAGSTLTSRIPFLSRSNQQNQTPAAWDLSMFTSACSDIAANRELDSRGKALVNRLLVDANEQGYPLSVLSEPVESLANIDWRQKWAARSDGSPRRSRETVEPSHGHSPCGTGNARFPRRLGSTPGAFGGPDQCAHSGILQGGEHRLGSHLLAPDRPVRRAGDPAFAHQHPPALALGCHPRDLPSQVGGSCSTGAGECLLAGARRAGREARPGEAGDREDCQRSARGGIMVAETGTARGHRRVVRPLRPSDGRR